MSELSIRERLQQLQYDIQKLTTESGSTSTTTNPKLFNDTTENNNQTSSSSSFQLGIQLFGSFNNIMDIEHNIQEKIQQYQNELQNITNALSTTTMTTTSTVDRHYHYYDHYNNKNYNELNDKEDEEEDDIQVNVSVTTEFLQMKLLFLKECSIARSLLDASMQQSKNENDHDPLEQSTILLLQSYQSLQKAYTLLQSSPLPSSSSLQPTLNFDYNEDNTAGSNDKDNNDDDMFQQQQQEQQKLKEPLYHMYDIIHASWRRQKIFIMTTMKQIWNTIMTHTPTSMTILYPKSSTTNTTTTHSNHPLRTFFNVYHVLWKDQQEQSQEKKK